MSIVDVKHRELRKSKFGLEDIWRESERLARISRLQASVQLARQAWSSVRAAPLTAILTSLTITVVLLLVGIFILALENLSGAVEASQQTLTVRLYLKDTAPKADIEKLSQEIRGIQSVESVQLRSKADALEEFQKALAEQAELLQGLETENPLPASLEIKFRERSNFETELSAVAQQYSANPLVQHVQYSQSLLGQLGEMLRSIRFASRIALLLLLAMSGFVIAIAIRLALYGHRQEIQIMRLVGAEDYYIQLPFLIEGLAQGLLGSLGAILGVLLLYRSSAQGLASSTALQGFLHEPQFLSWSAALALLLAGPLVGLIGSYLSVQRFQEE